MHHSSVFICLSTWPVVSLVSLCWAMSTEFKSGLCSQCPSAIADLPAPSPSACHCPVVPPSPVCLCFHPSSCLLSGLEPLRRLLSLLCCLLQARENRSQYTCISGVRKQEWAVSCCSALDDLDSVYAEDGTRPAWSAQRLWHGFNCSGRHRLPGRKLSAFNMSLLGTCKMGSSKSCSLGKVGHMLLGRIIQASPASCTANCRSGLWCRECPPGHRLFSK